MDPESDKIKRIIEQIPEEDLKDLLALNETISLKSQLERIIKQIPDEDLKDLLALNGAGSFERQFKAKLKNEVSDPETLIGSIAFGGVIAFGLWFGIAFLFSGFGGAQMVPAFLLSGTIVFLLAVSFIFVLCHYSK